MNLYQSERRLVVQVMQRLTKSESVKPMAEQERKTRLPSRPSAMLRWVPRSDKAILFRSEVIGEVL